MKDEQVNIVNNIEVSFPRYVVRLNNRDAFGLLTLSETHLSDSTQCCKNAIRFKENEDDFFLAGILGTNVRAPIDSE